MLVAKAMSTSLRLAQPADALAVATVHVASWQVGYRDIFDAAFLDALSAEERAQRYDFTHNDPMMPRTTVALDGGDIIGFATIGPSRDHDLDDAGELMALYVHPSRWRSGVGSMLLSDATTQLTDRGFSLGSLWVLTENHRAESLYRRAGWTRDGAVREETPWGVLAIVRRLVCELNGERS